MTNTRLEDIDPEDVAKVLLCHGIHKVALSSCLSSYTDEGARGNMSMIFIESGITSVIAMSYQVTGPVVHIFYKAFYEALIYKSNNFHDAADAGREALRSNQTRHGETKFKDYWIPQDWKINQMEMVQFRDFLTPQDWQTKQTEVILTTKQKRQNSGFQLHNSWDHMQSVLEFCFQSTLWLVICFICISLSPTIPLRSRPYFYARPPPQPIILKNLLHEVLRTDIRILALEDKLKDKKYIYLWGHEDAQNAEFIKQLEDGWRVTNFISSMHGVHAKRFLLSKPEWLVWLVTHVITAAIHIGFQYLWSDCTRRSRRRLGKRLLVIEDFHRILNSNISKEKKRAFRRVSSIVRLFPQKTSYLIIIGETTGETWSAQTWTGEEKKWGAAVPHWHDIKPPDYHGKNIL